ncbi:MAG: CPBP family intramembrane metalloprotease [Phycisphaerae bacterium]|nr:CPBP family intramembrane metalloprotease [Phycisphaerae bacterium]
MLHELTPLELSEANLLETGIAVILVIGMALTWQRRWGSVLRLPDPPEHRIEPADLLVGLLALFVFPAVFLHLFSLWSGSSLPVQPTSAPAGEVRLSPQEVLAQTAGGLSALVVFVYLGAMRIRGGLAGWGLWCDRIPRHVVTAVVAYVAVFPVCAGLLVLTREVILFFDSSRALPDHVAIQMLHAEDLPVWIKAMTVIGALVLAPIVEELFFRGLLQTALARWWRSQWLAVVFSGCAFGLLHMQAIDTVPALAFFGVVLGYLYARTGSLVLVILLHAVFNGKTVLWIAMGR